MTRSALPNDGGHPLREMEDLLEGYGRALDRLGRMASDLLPKGDSTPRVDIQGPTSPLSSRWRFLRSIKRMKRFQLVMVFCRSAVKGSKRNKSLGNTITGWNASTVVSSGPLPCRKISIRPILLRRLKTVCWQLNCQNGLSRNVPRSRCRSIRQCLNVFIRRSDPPDFCLSRWSVVCASAWREGTLSTF